MCLLATVFEQRCYKNLPTERTSCSSFQPFPGLTITPKAEATKATTAMTPDTHRTQGVTITSEFLQHLKMEQKASELLY